MGKLNILYHKSYHVYNRENVERVKRDELKAQLEAEAKNQSTMAANSEARLSLLRAEKEKTKLASARENERRMNRALDDQLKGKRPVASEPVPDDPPRRSTDNSSIIDPKSGHINFWSSLEHQSTSKQFENSKFLDQNESYVRDQKKAEEKWEAMITMRLDRPAHELKPWYSQTDLKNGEEKKLSARKLEDRSYKEKQLKNRHDPLSSVQTYLHQRDSVRSKSGPSSLSLLPHRPRRKERQASRSPSPAPTSTKCKVDNEDDDDDYMPTLPPISQPALSSSSKTKVLKVDSDAERRRAQELIAAHQRKINSAPSETATPMAYTDLYNRDDMRAVMNQKRRRWDDEPMRSKKTRYWDS
ncbi:hypothetical protein CROQUDRAFT_720950 [Cronartium quercuum f. sp. fusiforme G11]|uniref:CBF1-interacting co-repressor CIR N-terminal domain-containing protein n=1 Tax=Cronartium quercuum f. sp. fusiforme G11 TaxID=708437 RepID=A0A9P6TFC8_9BASI|nr:hypothetical protein CROQUDRAFT_720950 [Cronartium quercuum f. sp. fusiforme G11]